MISSILIYLLNSALCLTIFIVCYRVLFHLHLPHTWNRWLLIGGLVGSFTLPLFSVTVEIPYAISPDWKELNETVSQFSPTVEELSMVSVIAGKAESIEREKESAIISFWEIGFMIYLFIGFWFAFRFSNGLSEIFKRIQNSIGEKRKSYFLLKQMNGGPPSSFFSFILIDDSFDELNSLAQEQIIAHELIHIEEKHSWDILFIELIQVIQWFNPFVHFYKKTIQEIHEYIADEKTTQVFNKYEYSRLLVNLKGNIPTLALVNGFAKSLISNRIQMLMNPSDPSRGRKYWILPIVLILTGIFSCDFSFEQKPLATTSMLKADSLAAPIETPFSKKEEIVNYIPVIKPINAKVDVAFGMRMHPIMKYRRMHTGVDFIVPTGTPVHATADGIVKIAGTEKGGYGVQIQLVHYSGKGEFRFQTKYAHLLSAEVKEGQSVKQGDVIGFSGNSGLSRGPHLHYEVIDKTRKVDPENYFPQGSLPTESQNSKEEKRFLTDRDEMSMD